MAASGFGPFQSAFTIFLFYTATDSGDVTVAGLVAVAGCTAILTAVPCFWPELRRSMVKHFPKTESEGDGRGETGRQASHRGK